MTNANDILGFDILLDEKRRAVIAANGELVWCDGLNAAVQDVKLRVFTYLGGLFYDQKFGSTIPDYIYDESTKSSRMSLNAEVRRRIEMDSRVLAASVKSEIIKWDEKGIQINASWFFWDSKEPQNISVSIKCSGREKLIKDIDLERD